MAGLQRKFQNSNEKVNQRVDVRLTDNINPWARIALQSSQ